jgi:hypothetical protein
VVGRTARASVTRRQAPVRRQLISLLDVAHRRLATGASKIGMNSIHDTASKLFDPAPNQWGLRGDPFLWREMQHALEGRAMPESVERLTSMVHNLYVELTGLPMSHRQPFHVPRLDRGGMSGGMVCPAFWVDKVLPLLRKRFEDYRANEN